MLDYQFVAVEVFTLAFTFGAFTRDWLSSAGFVFFVLFTAFYPSDFSFLPPTTGIYYHIWLPVTAIAAALAGHIFACAAKCPPLIRINYFRSSSDAAETKMDSIPAADILTALFVLSGLTTATGINLWLGRTVSGLAPIGTTHETAGIAMTVCGSIALLLSSAVLSQLDVRARLALKYLWLFTAWPLVFLLTDYLYYHYVKNSPIPELSGIASYIGVSFVMTLAATHLPIRRHTDNEDGVASDVSYDPFYKNKKYSWLFIGGIGFISTVGGLAFTIAASWPDNSLAVGTYTLLGTAALSLLLSLLLIALLPKQVDMLKSNQPVFKPIEAIYSMRSIGNFTISDSNGESSD